MDVAGHAERVEVGDFSTFVAPVQSHQFYVDAPCYLDRPNDRVHRYLPAFPALSPHLELASASVCMYSYGVCEGFRDDTCPIRKLTDTPVDLRRQTITLIETPPPDTKEDKPTRISRMKPTKVRLMVCRNCACCCEGLKARLVFPSTVLSGNLPCALITTVVGLVVPPLVTTLFELTIGRVKVGKFAEGSKLTQPYPAK